MKILVTGGSGLVGRFVVDELAKEHEISVLDLKPPHRNDVLFLHADILDPSTLEKSTRGCAAVVHLAGIPHPLNDPPEKVYSVNAVGTFNMLEASIRNDVKTFVFMSSESTLGFTFSRVRMWPAYVPLDEQHPLRPQDPYGLSKVAGELACAGFSRRSPIRTVCLRAPWIWVPQEAERQLYRGLVAEYDRWEKNLWGFIHVFDVATAIRLAVEKGSGQSHDVFFVSAAENWAGIESRTLLSRFYPETTTIARDFVGASSFLSIQKAKSVLGFKPRYSAKDIL